MNNDKSAIQVIAGAARCPEYSPSMVKALMKKLETNEKAFALLMNVTPSTVRLWTTGAAHPCGMARRLMQIYESGPEIVCFALRIATKVAMIIPPPSKILP